MAHLDVLTLIATVTIFGSAIFIGDANAPTYCWQTAVTRVPVVLGGTSVQFNVSIDQSGSAFPSYISKQCASLRISGTSSDIIHENNSCCFSEANITEISCTVIVFGLNTSTVGEQRLSLLLERTERNLVCNRSLLSVIVEVKRRIYRIHDLVALRRRPTYLLVQWKAPPSPYNGSYLLTYGSINGMTKNTIATSTSSNITGLQPFTRYRVTVQANNVPDEEFPLLLSEVFTTLPDAKPSPGKGSPIVFVPQFDAGSRAVVDIVISLPTFPDSYLSHLWVVCIRNILSTTRDTAPDTAFPDSSTFGTYDSAEDNVPYIASEFDAAGISFPYTFGVGNETEKNDFPDQYRNGPVIAERDLYCFVRYFVSTEVMPMERKRRDAIPNRQYDVFQSTYYKLVNIGFRPTVHPSTVFIVLLAVILLCAVGPCVFIVTRVYRRLKQSKKRIGGRMIEFHRHGEANTEVVHFLNYNASEDAWEIPRSDIKVGEKLGQGNYGAVFKGQLTVAAMSPRIYAYKKEMDFEGKSHLNIAVKMLRRSSRSHEQKLFVNEIEVMKRVSDGNSPHVLKMLGCVTTSYPMMLVLQFVPHGNLKNYLRAMNTVDRASDIAPLHMKFTSFSYQIASGMEFLMSKGVLHRDLACRNILVGDNELLKICDFGLAKETLEYMSPSALFKTQLPVRWLPPEVFLRGEFSEKSDVFGDLPYSELAHTVILSSIMAGYRLEPPKGCPDEIYSIMKLCWNDDKDSRPTFLELKEEFDCFITEEEKYNYLSLLNEMADGEESAPQPIACGDAGPSVENVVSEPQLTAHCGPSPAVECVTPATQPTKGSASGQESDATIVESAC